MIAAYAVPAMGIWTVLGFCLAALPLTGAGLVGAVAYGLGYGRSELAGGRGLPVPGRRWQVPQTMMIDSPPARRVAVWGALLGPGFVTRNPFAGFGLLPLAVAAEGLSGPAQAVLLAAAIGLAHSSARAVALLRDVAEVSRTCGAEPAFASVTAAGQLELLLRTVYWRRLDGALLLTVAVIATALAVGYF